MKKIIIVPILILLSFTLDAQNSVEAVLKSIEENNTTLKSLRHSAEAEKLENKTGIYLPAPEAEFGYLWGNRSANANRTDVSVSQHFDIPTITGMKRKLSDKQNVSVEWQYKAGRLDILLEAKQYCMDLIYFNLLKKELEIRLSHAEDIADAWQKRLNSGDANLLEYNKTRLNLVNAQGEISLVEVERTAVISQLERLNGGNKIDLSDSSFEPQLLPATFDEWFSLAEQKNPLLAYMKHEAEISRDVIEINKAKGLPHFSAGYLSEKVGTEHFQGVVAGISIPLWENKNRVAQAKMAALAAEARHADVYQQFYNYVKSRYERSVGLRTVADNYREVLDNINSAGLLKKALDAGEISVLDYLTELSVYYSTVNLWLEAERDYHKSVTELRAVEL